MRLFDACEPMFARHETFHPRYSWFRKAYAYVSTDPKIFSREEAPLLIGVGKNMVRSIRFWGLASKLIETVEANTRGRSTELVPTPLGHTLFGEFGWDPYMEDPGTLWLLHWLLLAPPSLLPVWWIAFNNFPAIEFKDDELLNFIMTKLGSVADWRMPHPSSLRKDVSALLRTYSPGEPSGRLGIDDVLDCPLRELSLISQESSSKKYRFADGLKVDLPPEVIAYSALSFVSCSRTGGNTVTLGILANESGGPGKVFRLTEREILVSLELLVRKIDTLELSSSTGSVQLSWTGNVDDTALEVLDYYYRNQDDATTPIQASDRQNESEIVS